MPLLATHAAVEDLGAICKQGRFNEAITRLVFLCQQGVSIPHHIVSELLENCLRKKDLVAGTQLKRILTRGELNSFASVLSDNLIRLFASCNHLQQANEVFESVPRPTIYTWNAIISAHSKLNADWNALYLFEKMQQTGALQKGRFLHMQIIKRGLKADGIVGSSLVDMYAKCGSLVESWETLDYLHSEDVVSWNALIAGYAQQCEYTLAQECLQVMHAQGLKPDSTTYVSILAACSHAGKVEDGYWYYKFMTRDHITPNSEHFNCMIDLLSRAGYLSDAEKMLKSMPILANDTGWTSVLAACRRFGNPNLARECFEQIILLDPNNAAAFILMSNIYADFGMWEYLDELYKLKESTGTWINTQKAFVECNDNN